MNKIIVPVLLGLGFCCRICLAVEIYFSPSSDCEDQITKAIEHSKVSIDAAVYSINNKKIANALIGAQSRGVKVRILTDRTQASSRSSLVLSLLKAGVDLKIHSVHKIEHNKFGVFDDDLAINGSFNWTEPAARVNSENCAVMPEKNAVASFKKRFAWLWSVNSAQKSAQSLTKILKKRAVAEADAGE